MDPPMRNDFRDTRRFAGPAAPGCLAACRPEQLCDFAGGEESAGSGLRAGTGRGAAADFSAATADPVLFRPIPLLPEFLFGELRLSDMGPLSRRSAGSAAPGTIS